MPCRCRAATGSRAVGGLRFSRHPECSFRSAMAFLMFLFPTLHQMGTLRLLCRDNPVAARNMGIPVRPMTDAALCPLRAGRACVAGLLTAASPASDQYARRQFDAALRHRSGGGDWRHRPCGGKGGVRNVLCGVRPLIGILLNAMTIIDISVDLPEPDQVDDPARRHHRRRPYSIRVTSKRPSRGTSRMWHWLRSTEQSQQWTAMK